ncbi:hypothetical protein EVAR_14586_1 [Eumeta japonica]|uniref:Uncharacterized protein n=1 Tax=Eumeta variegata TaxID=151549 RepID=A0A4C1UUU3_EUMVA|nr:hypothetical protein EVAR_14586_1 [Eumeta japonica]
MDEIMKALKRIKIRKAVGFDRVSSETLRDGGIIMASLLYQHFINAGKALGHGMNSELIQALQSLYKISSAGIRINGGYTDWLDTEVSDSKTKVIAFDGVCKITCFSRAFASLFYGIRSLRPLRHPTFVMRCANAMALESNEDENNPLLLFHCSIDVIHISLYISEINQSIFKPS